MDLKSNQKQMLYQIYQLIVMKLSIHWRLFCSLWQVLCSLACLKLYMLLRMFSNLWSSCFCLHNAGIIGVCHHTWLIYLETGSHLTWAHCDSRPSCFSLLCDRRHDLLMVHWTQREITGPRKQCSKSTELGQVLGVFVIRRKLVEDL